MIDSMISTKSVLKNARDKNDITCRTIKIGFGKKVCIRSLFADFAEYQSMF